MLTSRQAGFWGSLSLDLVVQIKQGVVDRAISNFEFWLLKNDGGVRSDGRRHPNTGTDDTVVADGGFSAENRSVRIDHHVVFDGGVAFGTTDQFAVAIGCKTERTERDALVDLHVIADIACFPDNDTSTMIDEEMLTDSSSGMDIDSRLFVGPFAHHSRYERDF